MASQIKRKNIDIRNKLRTQLLILINNELSFMKKSNKTKINDKLISEVETFYYNINDNIIKLKEENFIPYDFSDVIQTNKWREKYIYQSPDIQEIKIFNNSKIVNFKKLNFFEINQRNEIKEKLLKKERFNFMESIFSKKSLISSKKNMYFRKNTLKLHEIDGVLKKLNDSKVEILKHHDMCNLEKDNISGISKKKKTVKGFGYLNELANKLKIIKNKNSNIDFDEFTKIIEDDVKNQGFSNEKNPATKFYNSTKNLFKLLGTVKDLKSINEVEFEENNNNLDCIHDYEFAEKNILLKNNKNSKNIFEKSEITKNLLLKTSNNEGKNNYIKYCENDKLNKKENEKYSFFDIQNKSKFSKNSEENDISNNTKNKIKFNFVQNSKDNKFNNDSSFSFELKKVEIEREENSSNKYKSNLKSVKKINKFVTNNKKQDFSILKLLKCKLENLTPEETLNTNKLDEINNHMKNKFDNESNFHKTIQIEKNVHDSNVNCNPTIIKNFDKNYSSKIIKPEKRLKLYISNNNKKSNRFEKFKIFNIPDKEKIQTISNKFIKKTELDDHIYLLNSFISSNSSSQYDSDDTCHVSKIINCFDNPTSKNSENLNNSFHHKNYKNEKTDFFIKLHDCSSHSKELKEKRHDSNPIKKIKKIEIFS